MATPSVLDEIFTEQRTRGDRAILEFDGSWISFAEAQRAVYQILNGFGGLGIGSQDRVAIVSRNGPEALLCLLAALGGGPVLVPINHRLSAVEMRWQIDDARCSGVIAESEFVEQLRDELPEGLHQFEIGLGRGGWKSFQAWISLQDSTPLKPQREVGSPYLQIYTSGTTGRAKGVLLTEENCEAVIRSVGVGIDAPLEEGQVAYQGFPLFHVGGVFVTTWLLTRGLTLIFKRDFDPAAVNRMIASGRVGYAAMVPAMIQACLGAAMDMPVIQGLKAIFYGASPINEGTLRRARDRYGCDFVQVYGMTETHSTISVLTIADHRLAIDGGRPDLIRSAGRPLPGCDVRIVDPSSGKQLSPGERGEICIRGSQVTQGYWQRPEATEEVIREGFLFTGDAGYLDEDGYLFIVDRLKDIIVSGGENIASKEIEDVLMAFPGVKDAAVIGIPDERWGEAVLAVIVADSSVVDVTEVAAHCRSRLGGFKVPKTIMTASEIPRNGAGKVLKNALREPYWKNVSRGVA